MNTLPVTAFDTEIINDLALTKQTFRDDIDN